MGSSHLMDTVSVLDDKQALETDSSDDCRGALAQGISWQASVHTGIAAKPWAPARLSIALTPL